jgi:phosphohistidine phosphatase
MKVWFLRHADALDGSDDAARPLSPKGEEQCRQMGRFLRKTAATPTHIYASPLVRARQTAEHIAEAISADERLKISEVAALLNETGQREFDTWLARIAEGELPLLVGHEPSISARVRRLLGIQQEDALRFPKAALACVEMEAGSTPCLKLLVTPKGLGY